MYATPEKHHIRPTKVGAAKWGADAFQAENIPTMVQALATMGIGLDAFLGSQGKAAIAAMDALQPTVTTASIGTPIQFLQNWLPGFVGVVTAARKIDDLIGITTSGSWEDAEVVQGVLELTGQAVPYGDLTNIPLASYNTTFEARANVRFEQGLRVGRLEEAQAARMRVDAAASKREAAALVLEINRNTIGFYGYNAGLGKTYGYLNDPSLPAYTSFAANEAGETQWADKDALDIIGDILTMAAQLRSQSQDTIDPYSQPTTLGVATDAVSYLSKINQYNVSVMAWIKETFNGNMRIVSAPQLNGAQAGDNVAYLSADSVSGDGGTDGGRTWVQVVPAKFQALGVEMGAKGYTEDYMNATAGALLKRPYAVVRKYGC